MNKSQFKSKAVRYCSEEIDTDKENRFQEIKRDLKLIPIYLIKEMVLLDFNQF